MMSSDPANTLPPEYDDSLPKDYDPAYTADISTKMRVPDVIGVKGENGVGHKRKHHMSGEEANENEKAGKNMSVPEKIIYTGNNESLGMRKEPELHLDLEMELNANHYIGLNTPPRHLTIDDAFKSELERIEREREQERVEEEERERETRRSQQNLHLVTSHDQGHDMFEQTTHDQSLPNGFSSPSPQHTSDTPMMETSAAAPVTPTKSVAAGDYRPNNQAQKGSVTPGGSQYMVMSQDEEMLLLRRQIDRLARHVQRLDADSHARKQTDKMVYAGLGLSLLISLIAFFKK